MRPDKPGTTPPVVGHYQGCITQARRRYLAALKAPAAVRKLALPALLFGTPAGRPAVAVEARPLPSPEA